MIIVVVTAAQVSDQAGARQLFQKLQPQRRWLQRLALIWADGAYQGHDFLKWVFDTYRWILEVVLRQDQQPGFRVVPKRWVVERTFGWLQWCRRLSKDYEVLPQSEEAFIHIAMIRLMAKRLAV